MEGKSEDILVDNFINVTVGRWWVHPLASFDTRNHSATPKWRPLTANRLSTIYDTGSSFFFFLFQGNKSVACGVDGEKIRRFVSRHGHAKYFYISTPIASSLSLRLQVET